MASLKQLIEELCKYPSETEFIEFKESFFDFDKEGQDFCALANSATLHNMRCAYKVWGIADDTHEVVGTDFRPRTKKTGNQDLEIWLREMLSSNVHFEFQEGEVFGKHIVVAKIAPATYQIARFKNIAYIRTGSSTQKLKAGSKREADLWNKVNQATFEAQFSLQGLSFENVSDLIDIPAYFNGLNTPMPSNEQALAHTLEADKIIEKNLDGTYAITNLGAILFARDLNNFPSARRKALRVMKYSGPSRITMLKDNTFQAGYAVDFETAFQFVNALLPSEERIDSALRKSVSEFPPIAVRELMGNSLVHQDFQIAGAGPMVEVFDGRIEVTNPGAPLVDVERIVNDPPFSRNELLAGLMRRLGMCEEAGTGWDKIIEACEANHLPAPKIEVTSESTRVVLYGHRAFKDLSPEERREACYWHVCVRYAARTYASNQSLRERFGIKASNSAQISRLIKTCIEENLIKPLDPETSPRYMRYIPAWV